MLRIPCPWCGVRDETEFNYGGQAGISRPRQPEACSDDEWADFLFVRDNPKGRFAERWVHTAGCRRWFNLVRHTVTHEIVAVHRIGERVP
jgi:heterotetrameric sarcosine oxidase delta subunit